MKTQLTDLSKKILFTIIIVNCSLQIVNAQWSSHSATNTSVCTALDSQNTSIIISDGSGGAFIGWMDRRFGTSAYGVYVQKINSSGAAQWQSGGIRISMPNTSASLQEIFLDGSGGIILLWVRNGTDIYGQRINSSGEIQWGEGGLGICTQTAIQTNCQVIPDGSSNYILAWEDYRLGTGVIYAQKINSAGTVLWGTDGVRVSTAPAYGGYLPKITADGIGGAFIAWHTYYDVYVMRIDGNGGLVWGGPVLLSTINVLKNTFQVITGNGGSVIVAWDELIGGSRDILAMRLDRNGAAEWSGPVVISNAAGNQTNPVMVKDGSGGAIIAWEEGNIYAQRINSAGTVMWTANGISICSASNNQNNLQVLECSSGCILTWADYRLNSSYGDIYVQRLNTSGGVEWTSDGIKVCSELTHQSSPSITGDGSDGAIISWNDSRNGAAAGTDIYCQRIQSDGSLPVSLAYFNWEPDENTVELRWGTYEELNNSGFYIERKKPGSGDWFSAGFINGHGTTTEPQDYRFDDLQLTTGEYLYRLKQVDFNGNFEYFNLQEYAVVGIPRSAKLSQNYPNPFNPTTKFNYHLPFNAKVKIKAYNTAGIEVLSLVDDIKQAGYYHLEFDGSRLASGIYFYRIIAEGLEQKYVDTKKMVLVK